MAVKDSIGGWKDNAHLMSLPKACSTLKHYLGAEWSLYLKSFGIKDMNCPVAPVILYLLYYYITLNKFIFREFMFQQVIV